jgi:TonB family protein
MRFQIGLGLLATALTACAGRTAPGANPAPVACQAYEVDRAWLSRGPVYQPCNVDEPTTATVRAPTGYHPLDCANASATLLFVVDTTGAAEPRTIKAVHATSTAFARAAITAVQHWRFKPALKGGRRVRQVAQQRFDFQCQQVPQGG